MDPLTENQSPQLENAGEESPSPESGAQPTRSRRWRSRRLVIVAAGGFLLLLVIAVAIISIMTTDEVAVVDPATLPPAQPKRLQFQAAVAHTVQSGDDTIRLFDFSPTSEQLETLSNVERLRILRIDSGSLTPEAGRVLASMPHMEQLHFRGVTFDDETLDAIAKSQTIWLLNISGAKLSDTAIARLADMPRLRQLRLAIDDAGNRYAEAVAKIKKLRALHLIGVGINNDGLKQLASLPNLESIYIDDSNVNDDGWKWLFENKTQLHVHIDQKHHDRDPQKH